MLTNATTAQKHAARRDDSHYTEHTEPPRVGGCTYWRCIHCGRESVVTKREVLHREDCPLARDR